MDNELTFAKDLAARAKCVANKYYRTELNFKTKSDTSPVTIADEAINQMVIEQVQLRFPRDGVLGEEQTWNVDRPRLWICDPIDGTIAFSMCDPTFMFSLALVVDGVPVVAVTADLSTGDVFHAVKDGGAFRNDKAIRVSQRPLQDAWLAFPTSLNMLYGNQALYQRLNDAAYQTNIIHGGVFKGMLIAQGLADATPYARDISPWDIAAVKLIVEEAGGKVTARDGSEPRFDQVITDGAIVSNAVVYAEVLDIMASAA